MFRSRCGVEVTCCLQTRAKGTASAMSYKATKKPPAVPSAGNSKEGKARMQLANLFEEDRKEAIRRQQLPLWERIRTFPWKFFATWMLLWSFGGTYIVAAFKGLTPGEKPQRLPSMSDEAYDGLSATPDFSKRGIGSVFYSPPAEKPTPDHVRGMSPTIGPISPPSKQP